MKNTSQFFTKEILSDLVTDIGVAFWVYDIKDDNFYYNSVFFDLIGYEADGGAMPFSSWENIIFPDDKDMAIQQLIDYKNGNSDTYSTDMRLLKSDGNTIWVHDSGKFTKFDENGKPTQIAGLTKDITQRKQYEIQFKYEQNKVDLAMKFAGFYIREWDLLKNKVYYDKNYLEYLGYTNTLFTDANQWLDLVHPDDRNILLNSIEKCVKSESKTYEYTIRIRKNDGNYIWVYDMGEVAQFDLNGKPILLIGGRININELETTKIELETSKVNLQDEINKHKLDLIRRDTILLELNQMSKKLMAIPIGDEFSEIAYRYLNDFSSMQGNLRLSIFRNKIIDGKEYSYLANKPKTPYRKKFDLEQLHELFKDDSIEYLSSGKFKESQRDEFINILADSIKSFDLSRIDYKNDFNTVYQHFARNKILNIKSKDLTSKEYIFTKFQGIKSLLMAPITLNNDFWGYIIIDSACEKTFSSEEEKTLNLLGSLIAQSVKKNQLELEALEASEYNQLMLNSSPVGCYLWLNGENISTNDEAVRLFDLNSQEEFLEKFYLLSPEYQENNVLSKDLILKRLQETNENGYARYKWNHCKLNGEIIPCEITLVKIPHRGKTLIAGYINDLREINALLNSYKESEERLVKAKEEALSSKEEALLSSQAKSNFLANMSHEIRTPMNAISGMTDIILRETSNSGVHEYAENIKRACDSLISIINDVLDISKIESGKLDIIEGQYKLSTIINDVLTIATNRLELKPLMFVTNVQADIPNNLIGDDVRIKQVMVNILNNAIKFTSEGSICFDITGEFAGGMLELKFSVTDTGSGISQEDMEKLFIEFERVNTTKNRTIEGTGLGLAISKRLSEMMNGSIEVESELGVGTTFTVTLIQTYDEYTAIAEIKDKKSILIFETREIYLNSMQKACNELELDDVVYCRLQSELIEAMQVKNFDYIFTSSMYLIKVQELIINFKHSSEIILLADSVDIKSKYDYKTIVLPATTISIANIVNGTILDDNSNKPEELFIAPECTVLVVDDNVVNLKVAQGLMMPYKFKIETAENGEEAVNKIKSKKYDLVFMDHMMPIMDGIDATVAVRNLEEEYFKNLPIIALTANAIIGTRENFISQGMNDFLAKPIKLSSLNEILAQWLPKEKQMPIELDSNNTKEKEKTLIIPNIDTKLGMSSVGGDYTTYVDILNMYYKDGLKRIQHIRNLFDKKIIDEYKIEVHALKSASASIGANDISQKARLLEEAALKNDLVYINQNTTEFIDDFNILLENIREALKGVIVEHDNTNKEKGEDSYYEEKLEELSNALDIIDINECENILENLFKFNWEQEKFETLDKIEECVKSYEYDEAIEIIKSKSNN